MFTRLKWTIYTAIVFTGFIGVLAWEGVKWVWEGIVG
ncbi:hypothetical protein FHT87_005133 [Rhizobium sp. BK316]|nr:hypothetical protein [Rhizobium sp. BK316]